MLVPAGTREEAHRVAVQVASTMDFSKGPSPNENSRLLESSTDENRWKDAKGNASLVDPALNKTPREVNGNIGAFVTCTVST